MGKENLPDKIVCPNCGHWHTGNFCPQCGQSKKELNRPFGEMFKDLMDSLFEFDTRLIRSLKPLLFKPGFLTLEYVSGRRATYYPPFKLYIFISIILFALIEISSSDMMSAGIVTVHDEPEVQAIRDSVNATGILTDTSAIPAILDTVVVQVGRDTVYYDYVYEGDSADLNNQIIQSLYEVSDSLPPERWLWKRVIRGMASAFESPEYAWNMFLKRTSQSLFLLLPVFALLLKLLYLRSKRFYIQHFVFSIYFHCFAFLVILMVLLVSIFFDGTVQKLAYILILVIPIYLFAGMKRFYRQSFTKTLLKFFLISGFYTVILVSGIMGIIILTLALI